MAKLAPNLYLGSCTCIMRIAQFIAICMGPKWPKMIDTVIEAFVGLDHGVGHR